ncbi:MAG: ABC transporter ATP-binding protein [Bacteroidales bacterium]|nr:ABC transporter ATP-binding protein [Bacteroidales bacterium]
MINLENLVFGYSRHYRLFDNLSLQLGAGNIYGLLGKNGTGKTTLIKLMSGLLYPQGGTCSLFGNNASKRYPTDLSDLFIVPEEFALPSVKMDEFVKMNSPFYPKFSETGFRAYLSDFEVEGNKKLHTLSFGQKKKFLLSFALATNTKLLLLDEPTNGLDIPSKSQFRKTVARSLTDEKSILISTHQARDLESLIDNIIILDNGKILFNQPGSMATQKLFFGKTKHLDNSAQILYKEETLGGYKFVMPATGQEESVLDLELFFNAIVGNPGAIAPYFNN